MYHPHQKGLSFVELLIVIAVAAILAAFAMPSLTDFLRNNRAVAQINDLQTSLNLARSEAIKRNTQVVICKSDNGTSCKDSGTAWQDGWIVFVDSNLDNQVTNASDIIQVHQGLDGGNTLVFTPTRVVYASSGLATSGTTGTFVLCDSRGANHAKGLIIGASGRARLAQDGDDNGVVENYASNDLSCSS